MICQTCQELFQAALDTLSVIPADEDQNRHLKGMVLHDTPQSLYESVVAGCSICRNVWQSDIRSRNKYLSDNHIQEALEGNVPRSYSEFCNPYGILKYHMETAFSHAEHSLDAATIDSGPRIVPEHRIKYKPRGWITFLGDERNGEYRFNFFPRLNVVMEGILKMDLIPEAPKIPNQSRSTEDSAKLWWRWLRTCVKSHKECGVPMQSGMDFVPDRLIEILDDDSGNPTQWKLIHTENVVIIQYFTLSHCWGKYGHLKLTKDNHKRLMEAQSVTCLPKTYQDALRITMSLRCCFIWIDSLCIIQDQNDENDWNTQSSKMGLIYGNADCNIAATWAKDGADGCFSERDSHSADPTIELKSGNGPSQCYRIQPDPDPNYYGDITLAPLNKRAWVVQERFLARRQLNFSKRQVFWECSKLSASEQYPGGIPKSEFYSNSNDWGLDRSVLYKLKPSLEGYLFRGRPRVWCALVDLYSNCDATRKSDKLIALAGLAREFGEITGAIGGYLAGLWKERLHQQLGWRANERRESRSRISPYVAPTWSWASLDGPVVSDVMYYDWSSTSVALGEVLEASVGRRDDNELFHSFTNSTLVLKGIALQARASSLPERSVNVESDTESDLEVDLVLEPNYKLRLSGELGTAGLFTSKPIEVKIYWDEAVSCDDANKDQERWTGLQEIRAQELLFMCLWYGNTSKPKGAYFGGICGLVLSKDGDSYGRVGYFRTTDSSLKDEIAKRFGNPDIPFSHIRVELDDTRLKDLIHIVTII